MEILGDPETIKFVLNGKKVEVKPGASDKLE